MERAAYTRIRILSVVALLLLAVICITGLLLIVSNPGLIILYAAAGIMLLYGGWLMLSAKGPRIWWGVAISVLAVVTALVTTGIFFSQNNNTGRLIVLTVASTLYLTLTGYIARLYWRMKRAAVHTSPYEAVRRPVLIINPKSGNGRATKARVAETAASQGIDTVVMKPGEDMVRLAETAISRGANILGVSGGDGSLGVMAKVAIEHDIPMVVLPGGTRCHFARDIGLDPDRITDALAGFVGIERRIDVGLIGDRVLLNNASFGLYADITSHPEYREHKTETTRRVMRRLAASDQPYYSLKFSDQTGKTWDHAAFVLIGINRYELLHIGELGQRKTLDGGELQIVALRELDTKSVRELVSRKHLDKMEDSTLAEWNTTTFTISNPIGWLEVGLDGENLRVPSPVTLRIMPKALRLMVPAEGVRHRPVRPVSTAGAKTLWGLIRTKEGSAV